MSRIERDRRTKTGALLLDIRLDEKCFRKKKSVDDEKISLFAEARRDDGPLKAGFRLLSLLGFDNLFLSLIYHTNDRRNQLSGRDQAAEPQEAASRVLFFFGRCRRRRPGQRRNN